MEMITIQQLRIAALEASVRLGAARVPDVVARAERLAKWIETGVLPPLPDGVFE